MKKIIFEVTLKEDCSIVSLLKEVNEISCRMSIDLKNGMIAVENIDDVMIDTVIECIHNYYTILKVSIDNLSKRASSPIKTIGSEERALLEMIGFAFDKLDASQKVEEQVEPFLANIGMTTDEKMIKQSFLIACDMEKINYENVMNGLHEIFPEVEVGHIKNILKETFKNWLKQYPTLAEKCPKISLMTILKVFAKKFS